MVSNTLLCPTECRAPSKLFYNLEEPIPPGEVVSGGVEGEVDDEGLALDVSEREIVSLSLTFSF